MNDVMESLTDETPLFGGTAVCFIVVEMVVASSMFPLLIKEIVLAS